MVDVKQASEIAANYFEKLLGKHENLTLEEVELSDDGKCWYITLGYDVTTEFTPTFPFKESHRRYKSFKIEAETGKVLSMKIRKLD